MDRKLLKNSQYPLNCPTNSLAKTNVILMDREIVHAIKREKLALLSQNPHVYLVSKWFPYVCLSPISSPPPFNMPSLITSYHQLFFHYACIFSSSSSISPDHSPSLLLLRIRLIRYLSVVFPIISTRIKSKNFSAPSANSKHSISLKIAPRSYPKVSQR